MSLRRRCRRCGSTACTTVCLLLTSTPAWSQAVENGPPPTPVRNLVAIDITGVFELQPLQPMLVMAEPDAGSPETACASPCFRGTITVRANQRWQLQVRLDPSRFVGGEVDWLPTMSPGVASPLVPGSWTTIVSDVAPTAGLDLPLRFVVRRSPAPTVSGGAAATLGAALQYRLLPLP